MDTQHTPAQGPISLQVDRPQEGDCWPSHWLPNAGLPGYCGVAAECCTHLLGGGGFSAQNMATANANILALPGHLTRSHDPTCIGASSSPPQPHLYIPSAPGDQLKVPSYFHHLTDSEPLLVVCQETGVGAGLRLQPLGPHSPAPILLCPLTQASYRAHRSPMLVVHTAQSSLILSAQRLFETWMTHAPSSVGRSGTRAHPPPLLALGAPSAGGTRLFSIQPTENYKEPDTFQMC